MAKHNQSARLGNVSDFSNRPTEPPKPEFLDSDIEARVANLERAVNEILLQLADISEQLDQPRRDQVLGAPPKKVSNQPKQQPQLKQQPKQAFKQSRPKPQKPPKAQPNSPFNFLSERNVTAPPPKAHRKTSSQAEPIPLSKEQVATLSDRIYELLLDSTPRTKAEICEAVGCDKQQYSSARLHLIKTKRMQQGNGIVAGKICNGPEGLAIWTQKQINTQRQSKPQEKPTSEPPLKQQSEPLSEEQVATLSDRIHELLLNGKPQSKKKICRALGCGPAQYAQAREHLIATERMLGGNSSDMVAGKICVVQGGLGIWTQEQIDAELQRRLDAKTTVPDENTQEATDA